MLGDANGDTIDDAELEQAMRWFMKEYKAGRATVDLNHPKLLDAEIPDAMKPEFAKQNIGDVITMDFERFLGNETRAKVGIEVTEPEALDYIEKNGITGFSFGQMNGERVVENGVTKLKNIKPFEISILSGYKNNGKTMEPAHPKTLATDFKNKQGDQMDSEKLKQAFAMFKSALGIEEPAAVVPPAPAPAPTPEPVVKVEPVPAKTIPVEFDAELKKLREELRGEYEAKLKALNEQISELKKVSEKNSSYALEVKSLLEKTAIPGNTAVQGANVVKTMLRSDFSKLTPLEQRNFALGGGKIND